MGDDRDRTKVRFIRVRGRVVPIRPKRDDDDNERKSKSLSRSSRSVSKSQTGKGKERPRAEQPPIDYVGKGSKAILSGAVGVFGVNRQINQAHRYLDDRIKSYSDRMDKLNQQPKPEKPSWKRERAPRPGPGFGNKNMPFKIGKMTEFLQPEVGSDLKVTRKKYVASLETYTKRFDDYQDTFANKKLLRFGRMNMYRYKKALTKGTPKLLLGAFIGGAGFSIAKDAYSVIKGRYSRKDD